MGRGEGEGGGVVQIYIDNFQGRYDPLGLGSGICGDGKACNVH